MVARITPAYGGANEPADEPRADGFGVIAEYIPETALV